MAIKMTWDTGRNLMIANHDIRSLGLDNNALFRLFLACAGAEKASIRTSIPDQKGNPREVEITVAPEPDNDDE